MELGMGTGMGTAGRFRFCNIGYFGQLLTSSPWSRPLLPVGYFPLLALFVNRAFTAIVVMLMIKTRMSLKTGMNDLPLVLLQLICFLMRLPLRDERLRENEALDGPATCKRQSCEADEKVYSWFCKSALKKWLIDKYKTGYSVHQSQDQRFIAFSFWFLFEIYT